MSVLIKGMDMPKRCVDCPIYFAGLCSVRLQNGKCPLDGRPDWCPMVDVPVPHGKLIDASDAVRKYADYGIDHFYDAYDLPDIMAEMPAVIEEER